MELSWGCVKSGVALLFGVGLELDWCCCVEWGFGRCSMALVVVGTWPRRLVS